ncbi:unnamed protein product [Miscanthus lutarioriparius]|uniref:Uncharacterized protein n=1 Tax=Miscanthus lutarioriparius TaxID=422564 RepID=A0A811Q4L4_9POAL|nr:unnamed protein product [Miscanthus lutarioriparius]
MATTYTRWVHHGEPLEVVPHEIDDHVDEHTSLNEDFGMNVDKEDDPDYGIRCMVKELYTTEEEDGKTMVEERRFLRRFCDIFR